MDKRKLAVLFPGQGAYYKGVLAAVYPQIARTFAEIDEVCRQEFGQTLSSVLFETWPHIRADMWQGLSNSSMQFALYGVDVTVYKILESHGLRPDTLIGHSFGEIAALVCAGAFTVQEGAFIVAQRVKALQRVDTDNGYMVALSTDAARARKLLDLVEKQDAVVAVENHAEQRVISGTQEMMDTIGEISRCLKISFVRLKSPYLFHSLLLQPAVNNFVARIGYLKQQSLQVPVFSPTFLYYYHKEDKLTSCLAQHLVLPLNFVEAIRHLSSGGGAFALGPRNSVLFAKLHGLSARGEVRALDKESDGVLFGDGADVVVLKKLRRALQDGDRVLAVLKAFGASSDGKGQAVNAPSSAGQTLVLRRTLSRPGVDVNDLDWIAAHATGTAAGDLAEFTALRKTIETSHPVYVTSHKSLIGSIVPRNQIRQRQPERSKPAFRESSKEKSLTREEKKGMKMPMGTPLDAMHLIHWASGASMSRAFPLNDPEPDPGVLGPTSLTWRLHEEQWMVAAAARAFLMQVAHPKVAQGAVDHSRYSKDPFGRVYRTITVMHIVMFGTTNEANTMARRINHMHHNTHGVLPESIGRYLAGETYSAMDPAVLLWVHMVTVDSWLTAYKTFVAPLSEEECQQYWQESCCYARLFGLTNATLPTNYTTVQQLLQEALASGEIAIGRSARLIAQTILTPPLPLLRKPLWKLVGLITSGLLPADIRQAYGLRWTLMHRIGFHLTRDFFRLLRHLFPDAFCKSSLINFARCRSQGEFAYPTQIANQLQ